MRRILIPLAAVLCVTFSVSAYAQSTSKNVDIEVTHSTGGTCGPDPAPPQAAALGYTCEVFWDNFTSLSTIDTTSSHVNGFKWYPGGAWPRYPADPSGT